MHTEHCPCCGQPNRCAQNQSDEPVEDCWCFAVPITIAQLERVPEHLRNRACLCPRCAQGLPAEEH